MKTLGLSGGGLWARVLAEKPNVAADVIFGFGAGTTVLEKREGLWEPYADPPTWRDIHARYKDNDWTWFDVGMSCFVLAGNKDLLAKNGQQQRVALARSLRLHPKVLLLDGPLSNLDADLRVQMRAETKRLQRALHQKVVFVTHDQKEATSISDWIMVMDQEEALQGGTPNETYKRPATPLSSVKGNR